MTHDRTPSDPQRPARDNSLSAYLSRKRKLSDEEAHREENHPAALTPVSDVNACWDEPLYIDTQPGLDQVIAQLRARGFFAYDSEFMGEQTYQPRLCLIQVATDQTIWLIDPQADINLTSFWELLADPSVLKISHAGQPDYEPLARHLGKPPAHTLDTQIAAGFLGMGYPLGLDKIILATTGVTLQKAPKFSQWDRRPLTPVQLRYAADDVRYLIHAGQTLAQRLREAGRYEWAIAECESQLNAGATYSDPLRPMAKIRSAVKMPQPNYSTLIGLLRWRDQLARRRDLPVRMIAPDDALVALAHEMPTLPAQVQAVPGLPRRIKEDAVQEILAVVREGRKNPQPLDIGLKAAHERSRDRETLDGWCQALRARCAELGIESTLAFSRRDVARLYNARVRGLPDYENRLTVGWRASNFDSLLRELTEQAIQRRAQRRRPGQLNADGTPASSADSDMTQPADDSDED